MGFLSSLIPMRVRLWLVAIGAALAAFWAMLQNAKRKGKADLQAKIDKANTEALKERMKIDEDVKSAPSDSVRRDLGKWVR